MNDYVLWIKIKLEADNVDDAINQLDNWMNIAEDNLELPGNGMSIEITDEIEEKSNATIKHNQA